MGRRMSRSDDEVSIEEEHKHAARGAWIALPLLPLCLLCFCAVFAITPNGRIALADFIVQATFDGAPLPKDLQIMYIRGFPGAARASCALERTKPRPANYKKAQERLATEYDTLFKLYKDNWNYLKQARQKIDEAYKSPADTPSDLVGGTRTYCR